VTMRNVRNDEPLYLTTLKTGTIVRQRIENQLQTGLRRGLSVAPVASHRIVEFRAGRIVAFTGRPEAKCNDLLRGQGRSNSIMGSKFVVRSLDRCGY